jgi:hypothetical protein
MRYFYKLHADDWVENNDANKWQFDSFLKKQ